MIHPGACWRVRFQDAVPGRWASIRADDPVRGRCGRQRERVLDGLLGGETSSEFAVTAGAPSRLSAALCASYVAPRTRRRAERTSAWLRCRSRAAGAQAPARVLPPHPARTENRPAAPAASRARQPDSGNLRAPLRQPSSTSSVRPDPAASSRSLSSVESRERDRRSVPTARWNVRAAFEALTQWLAAVVGPGRGGDY